jgi:glycine dehydrogenase subunit 2
MNTATALAEAVREGRMTFEAALEDHLDGKTREPEENLFRYMAYFNMGWQDRTVDLDEGTFTVAEFVKQFDLEPFLPTPAVRRDGERYWLDAARPDSIGRVHASYGNFGALVRTTAYIWALGGPGVERMTHMAIVNANHLMHRLKDVYDLAYPGPYMHEFVLSGKKLKTHGVKTMDVAKRLLDYGFYAPTVYFPLIVEEAMMIEPTESETIQTMDRFVDAMKAIYREVLETPDLVKNAPHTTPVRRPDEGKAARELKLRWQPDAGGGA